MWAYVWPIEHGGSRSEEAERGPSAAPPGNATCNTTVTYAVVSLRPLCLAPRAHYMTTAEPTALQAVVDQWFEECGGQPNGNRRACERCSCRDAWHKGAVASIASDIST